MILKIPSLHPNLKAEDTNFPVHFELHENKKPHLNLFLRSSWNLSTNFLACDKRVALRLWL